MEDGIEISCRCQSKVIDLGYSSDYQSEYEEAIMAIRNGRYGRKIQNLASFTEMLTIDVAYQLYLCEKCGNIEVKKTLDLYQPKKSWKAKLLKFKSFFGWHDPEGEKSISELDEALSSWIIEDENKRDFELARECRHRCSICRNTMIKEDEDCITDIKCPTCQIKYKKRCIEKKGEVILR